MADKQQNIFVNFKYQTAELEKGTQLVDRANAANNRLQQSAQDVGKKTASGYREATQSIGNMQIQLARLKTQIEVSSNPARVKQLADQYKQLKTDLDKATKAAFDNSKAMKEVGSVMGQVGSLIAAAFSVAVVRQIVNTTLELAKLAGNAEGVERAFRRSFANAEGILENLKTATHNTVSEFELMQRTLQATNLGVSIRELPILFEFAAARAQQTGESVDYLVNSIVRGIGRKSILVLDNLGLSATRLKEQFHGASLASQSVADVTTGVAEIARQELEKMGGYAETAATKIDQISARWQNLRVELGKKLISGNSDFSKFINESLEGLEFLLKGEHEYFEEIHRVEAAKKAEAIVSSDAFKKLKGNQGQQLDFLIQEIAERQRLIRLRDKEIDQAKARRQELVNNPFVFNLKKATAPIDEMLNGLQSSKSVLQATIPILAQYAKEVRNEKFEEIETLGIIQKKKKEIEDIQKAIEETKRASDLSGAKGKGNFDIGTLNQQLAIAQSELRELTEGAANIQFNVKFDKEGKATKELTAGIEKLVIDLSAIAVIPVTPFIPKDEIDKLEDAFNEAKGQLISGGIDIGADLLKSVEESELASLHNRMNNLKNFYDEQILLAGNNEKAKDQIRLREEQETAKLQKRMAEKEKSVRRFNIIIDTAASIAKTAAQLGFPAAIPFIALAAAQGAAQLSIVNRTPARFAKGVLNLNGPGTGTSDSIPARLSKGESVMTAVETKKSMGILKDIRAKKLDDRVLQDLKVSRDGVSYQPMDDSRIIKELKELKESQPDIVSINGKLYKEYRKGDIHKVRTRVKIMG